MAVIVESWESDAELGGVNATANTSDISFAMGGQTSSLAQDAVLVGALSG
ncbi:hypothetical protein Q7M_1389 (plasmid) [Borrelia crocidurae str. Achema]|uniref:Variable large protein n=1 Tax=Borrelia crocidurae (strain Achema) TaxID=1155096 RepID=I0FDU5_BORCA|nr:hypothetical protein Q7M_1389 [Borrelia crocidurae str. Achema]